LATKVLAGQQIEHEVFITERAGHAYELAQGAVTCGASLVFAWGGDGTINEVGRALTFGPAALGIIPAGSGNGLARELRVPTQPEQALKSALRANERLIDVGELSGRLFFNAAGFGFDAHVTALFNSRPPGRRGLLGYLAIAARELCTYRPCTYTITANGGTTRHRALLHPPHPIPLPSGRGNFRRNDGTFGIFFRQRGRGLTVTKLPVISFLSCKRSKLRPQLRKQGSYA
jgi:diacylglycerol kinase family enzyme